MKILLRSLGGFTLMEVLLVVVIIGALAVAGVANYYKSLERSTLNAALGQMRLIYYAQRMFFVNFEEYYPKTGDGDVSDIMIINDELNTSLSLNGFSISCADTDDPDTFDCEADRDSGAFFVVVTQDALSDMNPQCVGDCP